MRWILKREIFNIAQSGVEENIVSRGVEIRNYIGSSENSSLPGWQEYKKCICVYLEISLEMFERRLTVNFPQWGTAESLY